MLIAIPSKGRAADVKSLSLVPDAVLFVPAGEAAVYRKKYPNVVPVPDSVRGITNTRNWILKNTDDRWVVFVDDDLKKAGWIKLYEHNARHRPLTPEQWMMEFVRLFEVTEQLKYRLWGVDTAGAPRAVYPYKPFIFQTYVTASCCGIVNDGKTFYDETFPVKEDYELCLRMIKEDGGIVGARYLYWTNSHWADDGGCKDYRTMAMEQNCIRRLVAMYPGMIKQVTRGGSGYSISLNFG